MARARYRQPPLGVSYIIIVFCSLGTLSHPTGDLHTFRVARRGSKTIWSYPDVTFITSWPWVLTIDYPRQVSEWRNWSARTHQIS